jgi:septal ring factor EnvC (AmiA/AmiB activator)
MIRVVMAFVFILLSASFAQDQADVELRKNRSSLEKVKEEISALKKEIRRADIKSSSALDQIKTIDREISLLGKAKRLLNNEVRLLNAKISDMHEDLTSRLKRLSQLRERYQKRAVHLYKKGNVRDLLLLIESKSINQSLVRLKYYKFFSDQEKKLISSIKNEVAQIQVLEADLEAQRNSLAQSIDEKNRQETSYISKKSEKKVLVDKMQWNKRNLEKRLSDAQVEYEKLYQIILALERQRRESEKTGRVDRSFALNTREFKKNKGKLPWPVEGKILHAYGKQRNAQLKTTINNTGIDIRAAHGTKVQAIFTGIVSMITYLSGFGNTIIVDHGEGYYSVYSHLEDILVEVDQLVDMGEVIGLVGDSGSLEGSKLHFALFANQQTENPQKWLR